MRVLCSGPSGIDTAPTCAAMVSFQTFAFFGVYIRMNPPMEVARGRGWPRGFPATKMLTAPVAVVTVIPETPTVGTTNPIGERNDATH